MNDTYYTLDPNQFLTVKSSWQPEAQTNNKIQTESNLTSNWKYRQYMQQNANQIMKYNTMQTFYESGNNPYSVLNTGQTNKTPILFKSTYDTNNLGQISDLKRDYLKKEQMKSKMVSPYISTNLF